MIARVWVLTQSDTGSWSSRTGQTKDTDGSKSLSGVGITLSPKRGACSLAIRVGIVEMTGARSTVDSTVKNSVAAVTTFSFESTSSRARSKQPWRRPVKVTNTCGKAK